MFMIIIPVGVLQRSCVKTLTDRNNTFPFQLVHLHFGQELVSHHLQRIFGPRLKPINSTTTDERWELAKAVGKLRSDGTHTEQYVKILFTPAHKVVEQR